jgi:dipeptidyl aminopeptidase/acylaminoacyl peptidase
MAANDYIIVAPNRRGMPGWGVKWNADISKDWGGQPMRDYLAAADFAKTLPYVDGENGSSRSKLRWLLGIYAGRYS